MATRNKLPLGLESWGGADLLLLYIERSQLRRLDHLTGTRPEWLLVEVFWAKNRQGAENEKAFFWGSVFNETIHWFISLLLESHLLHMTESTSGKKLPGPTVTNMSSSVPSLSLTCCNKAVNNSNLQVWFHKSEASFVLRAVDVSLPFFVSGLDKGGLVRAWFWFWSLFTALGCSTLWRLRVKAVNVALRISC